MCSQVLSETRQFHTPSLFQNLVVPTSDRKWFHQSMVMENVQPHVCLSKNPSQLSHLLLEFPDKQINT